MSDIYKKARAAWWELAYVKDMERMAILSAALDRMAEFEAYYDACCGAADRHGCPKGSDPQDAIGRLGDERDALKARVEDLEAREKWLETQWECATKGWVTNSDALRARIQELEAEWAFQANETKKLDEEAERAKQECDQLRAKLAEANGLLRRVKEYVGSPVQTEMDDSPWLAIRAHLAKEGGAAKPCANNEDCGHEPCCFDNGREGGE